MLEWAGIQPRPAANTNQLWMYCSANRVFTHLLSCLISGLSLCLLKMFFRFVAATAVLCVMFCASHQLLS